MTKFNYVEVNGYFSRHIELSQLTYSTSEDVNTNLKSIFAILLIPEIVQSNNELQYSSHLFIHFLSIIDLPILLIVLIFLRINVRQYTQ